MSSCKRNTIASVCLCERRTSFAKLGYSKMQYLSFSSLLRFCTTVIGRGALGCLATFLTAGGQVLGRSLEAAGDGSQWRLSSHCEMNVFQLSICSNTTCFSSIACASNWQELPSDLAFAHRVPVNLLRSENGNPAAATLDEQISDALKSTYALADVGLHRLASTSLMEQPTSCAIPLAPILSSWRRRILW